MLKGVADLQSVDFSKGLSTISNIFKIEKDQTPDCMDVKINFDGSVEKRKGSNHQNAVLLSSDGKSAFATDSLSTLTGSLVAFWKLDAGGERPDSFSTHVLDDNNEVPTAAGVLGNAADFTASSSQYLLHTHSDTLAVGDADKTISTWIYLNSTGNNYTILSKRDADLNVGELDSNTILLLHFDGSHGTTSATDASSGGHTVTFFNSAIISTANSVFGGASLANSSSTSDQLSVSGANTGLFYMGDSDFTIDMRLRLNSVTQMGVFDYDIDANNFFTFRYSGTSWQWECRSNGTILINTGFNQSLNADQWYNLRLVKSGTSYSIFNNQTRVGIYAGSQNLPDFNQNLRLGVGRVAGGAGNTLWDGYIDEFRWQKGVAQTDPNAATYSDHPGHAFKQLSSGTSKEYELFVDSNDKVGFKVSRSGTGFDTTLLANSYGALNTASWYHVVAWHDTGDTLGLAVNLTADTVTHTGGIFNSGSAPFVIGAISNGSSQEYDPQYADMRIDETGIWNKVLTAQERSDLYNGRNANRFNEGFPRSCFGAFDFGASNIRWAVFSAGTGLYASSDLGVNFTAFGTSQTATYTHFERSKNVLIVTTDAYDPVVYWDGSGGTFAALMNVSAPQAKYCINHQGFNILLNTQTRKRAFYYEDENSQLTGDWADVFDLPSSQDDEITGAFVLRSVLYVSTKRKLFRVSFVGGNPDWSFRPIKAWGFVPRTIQPIFLKDIGEVITGMSWDRRMRLFDGADDKISSDNIENQGLNDFSMQRISLEGSGLRLSHAVVDDNEQVYKMCVALGDSTETSHILNFNGRTLAYYPYQNQPWQAMVMAESAEQLFLLAGDRSGRIHLLDSGNLDNGTDRIWEHFDSPFLHDKSPSEVTKGHKIDLYFSPESAGTINYWERTDFSNSFKKRIMFQLRNDEGLVQKKVPIDIRTTQNVYQYRLFTSGGTANPWKLNRTDYFVQGLGVGDT